MSSCAKFTVTGKVQGVFFRASTRTRAQELGLSGYAQNLPNGDVEILACGEESALAELERWLHVGPPAARVSEVARTTAEVLPPQSFSIA
jgi:acylphosphatase